MPMPRPRANLHQLRRFQPGDLDGLLQLYGQAVSSQCPGLYSPEQVQAWAQHPMRNDAVATTLQRGFTLVNPVKPGETQLAAFACLDPADRLALLYCDGRWGRQGRSTALLEALETHAKQQGVQQLRTEASQLSRPLLLRLGWRVEAPETVLFAGVPFDRWRMIKPLGDRDG